MSKRLNEIEKGFRNLTFFVRRCLKIEEKHVKRNVEEGEKAEAVEREGKEG